MSKLLIISGPTASGKTALAVKLAKKYNGELISADSRQIYQELDIGVGKDHPPDIKLHLIDLITPNQAYSVAQYRLQALKVIVDIQSQGKLPILVGCSGLYIDSIISPRSSYSIKPKRILRLLLDHLPLSFLQLILKFLDFKLFSTLNHSDVNNPRRLVRKIEISLSKKLPVTNGQWPVTNYLHLSLTAPNSYLYPRIDARVEKRLSLGHLGELTGLLQTYSWSDPGLQVAAYKVFQDYFQKKTDINSCIQKWKFAEHRDARHQKTWFGKQPKATFINITSKSYSANIYRLVKSWLINDKINHGTTKS